MDSNTLGWGIHKEVDHVFPPVWSDYERKLR
jgi:hypothetical protein